MQMHIIGCFPNQMPYRQPPKIISSTLLSADYSTIYKAFYQAVSTDAEELV